MPNLPFVGRKKELKALNLLLHKKTSSLVVVQGRRRIGKSRLIKKFAQTHKYLEFAGLAPNEHTTEQTQRNDFMQQLSALTNMPMVQVDDWSKAFILLASEINSGRVIVLLDEISWLGSKDPDFLGKLKNAWDLHFKHNTELILVLCSSVSFWIEKNILSSTEFLGRVSLTLKLKELSLQECNTMLTQFGHKLSVYEKFKILSITGGIPRYLEELVATLPADENIKRLCFLGSGILFREFKDIFSDLFSKRSAIYQSIVEALVNGSLEYNAIANKIGMEKSGSLSEYLEILIQSGFIARDYTWHLKTGIASRLSHYRLSDNYLRFYLKYIHKMADKIIKGYFEDQPLIAFQSWDSIMGLQFENLVLNNRKQIWKCLHINAAKLVSDNPFFQRATTRVAGCQIDYLIQTKYNNLFICEIKFSRNPLNMQVIHDMQRKIKCLTYPKGFACRPVLIHVNGVEQSVIDSDYFSNIIDFADFLSAD